MDTILEQKRKGQMMFRVKIDDFLSKSPYTRQNQQLTPQTIQDLLSSPNFEGVCTNGKINLEKFCDKIALTEGQYNIKELMRILGNRKEMKVGELHQLLKGFELTDFDLEEEIVKYFFEGSSFSLNKMEGVMVSLGLNPLNAKDKEILIECFDYDRNKVVNRGDIHRMVSTCVQLRKAQPSKGEQELGSSQREGKY